MVIAPPPQQIRRASAAADVLQMLQSADVTDPGATAYIVAPGGGQPTILSRAPREAGGQADQAPAREKDWAAELSTAQRLLQHEAAHGPLDLLATVAVAARAVSPPATLIVVSSGLSTAGGFDLQDVGWDANPRPVAAELKALGFLPDLTGYHVGSPAWEHRRQAARASATTAGNAEQLLDGHLPGRRCGVLDCGRECPAQLASYSTTQCPW